LGSGRRSRNLTRQPFVGSASAGGRAAAIRRCG
jgi:hypothetical protein